jgi:GT2 family glycosyltransferase/peptidoglycan/xylan/chitin deacetylase (PgdA/CDA1 family)
MKWTIVIPTRQRATMLASLFGSLAAQTCLDFEVVVVCDGEDADTRLVVESTHWDFPLRWIFHEENRGLAAARNTGAEAARGEFLLFVDDDVVPEPDLLCAHSEAHASAAGWPDAVVCGRIIEERQEPIRSKTDEFLQSAWERELAEALPAEGAPNTASIGESAERSAWFGLNCSIRRELFEKLGGFDARMCSDEEMEFGLRLYRAGVQTRYAPKAIVRHRGSRDQSSYYPRCWALSGELDVYRVRERGERSAQVRQLADMTAGSFTKRMLARAVWGAPETVLAVAGFLERLTDATGNRLSFGAWARLRRVAEYWNSVKGTGISERDLDHLVGPPGRILLFHSIAQPENSQEASYYISPDRFRRFISWLDLMHFSHVSPERWLTGELEERNVLLTFDDAYDDLYTELMPQVVLKKLRPLVFVVVDRIGQTNVWDKNQAVRNRRLLTLAQMREMQRAGVVFGSHSLTHPMLTSLSDAELQQEVCESKQKLEDLLGAPVDWFAYPYGDLDRRVRAAVLAAGYRAAVTTNGGFNRWQDPLALNRLEIDDRDWLMDFALKLATGRNYRRGILNRMKGITRNRMIRRSED